MLFFKFVGYRGGLLVFLVMFVMLSLFFVVLLRCVVYLLCCSVVFCCLTRSLLGDYICFIT